jgi:hypothetical protein
LKEAIPHAARVAVLVQGRLENLTASRGSRVRALQEAAPGLGIYLHFVAMPNVSGLDDAFAAMSTAGADAVKILPSTLFDTEWRRMAELALQYRMLSITEA